MKTVAYLRVSTSHQDVQNQKYEVLEYAHKNSIKIDDFIEIEMSSRSSPSDRKIVSMIKDLKEGDCIIVTELSRLGRSTQEVLQTVSKITENMIQLICIKQNLCINRNNDMQTKIMVTMFSLFSELERDLISARTKLALEAKKASGVKLGRKVGSLGKSRLDEHHSQLSEFINKGVSISSIAKIFCVSRGTVYNFTKTRVNGRT